ncbi:HD domain-containing phosphohydrolase [Alicyclobacillus mengziensis]|uniref:HD domain-containing protein n=1 Tax=Alicyclobacillus mengziensis TaxID=2931921 RepID=A0A9X7Z8M0_9BACL|nr:HD domain-containing phosphohydrolase [Alicyclobacillus mengziensis]QSO48361.1 HD domain-containing protein [Alicyclobacillus mengziensis]
MSWDNDFSVAKKLLSQGLFLAANSMFVQLEERIDEQSDKSMIGVLYDELGKIHRSNFANYKKSIEYFQHAIEYTNNKDETVRYTVHLASAYRKMSEFDTCYRYLMGLVGDLHEISHQTKGVLFANLSAIQGINGFYAQAITSTEYSKQFYSNTGAPFPEYALFNNRGLANLELGAYDKAEYDLKKSMELVGTDFIEPLSELGRLCLLQNRLSESIEYAERALDVIWSSIINYNKEEVARLCHLLAHISVQVGQVDLAMRLGEKAQVLFGQLGMWRQWQNLESQLEQWSEEPQQPLYGEDYSLVSLDRIRHFLVGLEALNLQELNSKKVSSLLDVRSYYVQLFSAELGLTEKEVNDLILASRFADYGLTALESEVVMNPTRSQVAFEQYKHHPSLGVKMVKALGLSDAIAEIIANHHENYDGSGYEMAKKGNEISYLGRVFRIVDYYTNGVVMDDRSHFEVMEDMFSKRGTVFDPVLLDSFTKMHYVE